MREAHERPIFSRLRGLNYSTPPLIPLAMQARLT